MLAALSLAFADSAAEAPAMDTGGGCEPTRIADTLPAPGQQGVPVDARLVAFLTDGCDEAEAWLLEVVRLGGAEQVVASTTIPAYEIGPDGILALTPEEALEAGTRYAFRVTPEGWGQAVEVGFVTGDSAVVGLEGLPVTTIDQASWYESGWLEVSGRVRPAADPDGLSFLLVSISGEAGARLIPGDDATVGFALAASAMEMPAEICVDVRQVDGRGRAVSGERVCRAPELRAMGDDMVVAVHHACSALGGEVGAFAVMMALLAIGRRR